MSRFFLSRKKGLLLPPNTVWAGAHAFLVAPANLTLPSISSSNGTVVGATLTRTPGTYSGQPAPTVSGQWNRGGVPIAGATGATYLTVAPDDDGRTITWVETATSSVGIVAVSSLPITMDTAAPPASTPVPDWANATEQKPNITVDFVTMTKPPGAVSGDLLVFFGAANFQSATNDWDQLSGWTIPVDDQRVSASQGRQTCIQYRVLTSADDAVADYTFTCTRTGLGRTIGDLVRVPGPFTGDPIEFIGTVTQNNTSQATHNALSGTTTVDHCIVFALMNFYGTDGITTTVSGTGWTKRKEIAGGGQAANAGYPLMVIADKDQATAGATGNCTFTPAVSDSATIVQVAFRPAGGSSTPADLPPLVGTLTPANNSAFVGVDGDSFSGYRDQLTTNDFGSITGGPFNFKEVWARIPGTVRAVDDVRAGSETPLAKIPNAEALRFAFRRASTGDTLGPFTLPWESAFNRYSASVPGSAAFMQAHEGIPLDLFYEEIPPTINAPRFSGFGANATGGQGGRVIYVTSGANSGPGTLRDALEVQTGPRVVLFKVKDIQLTGFLKVSNGNGDVSIYGQSAGGVQIRIGAGASFPFSGGLLGIRGSNVIIQGLKIRVPREGVTPKLDCISIGSGTGNYAVENVVVDHNDFEWGSDECVELAGGLSNVTVSNNIVAQGIFEGNGVHGYGLLMVTAGSSGQIPKRTTIHRNLLAYNNDRNPWLKHGQENEFVNNHIYGPGCQNKRYGQFGSTVSDQTVHPASAAVLNNDYEKSSQSKTDTTNAITLKNQNVPGSWYISGNRVRRADGTDEPTLWLGDTGTTVSTTTPPFAMSGIETDMLLATAVRAHVLANAGAFPPAPDAATANILTLVTNKQNGIILSIASTPGYDASSFTPRVDTDGDGIPDFYEGTYATVEDYVDALLTGAATPGA